MVTINDAIVPTADPRLPFGGRKKSGFGVTRGPEGLLELTAPRVIARRASNSWLPHLDVPSPGDEERFQNLLHLLHGDGWWSRFRSLRKLLSRGPKRIATTTTTNQT
jgi:aldehyde dehydrogenase (NAD+)